MMMRRVGTGVPVTPPETPRQPFGTACLRSLLSTSLARYARRLGPHTKLFGLDALLPRSLLPSRPTGSGTPPLRGGVWGHPRRGRAPRSASPLDGGPVSWRTPCEPRCPDCVRGAGLRPPNSTGPWAGLFRLGPKFELGSPQLLAEGSSCQVWTTWHPLRGPRQHRARCFDGCTWPFWPAFAGASHSNAGGIETG